MLETCSECISMKTKYATLRVVSNEVQEWVYEAYKWWEQR